MLGKSKIQRLDYEGPTDPTLFWPQGSPETDKTSSWTCLQEVEVRFGLGSLAGQWFFKGLLGDPFYDESSDWDEYVDCEGSGCDDPLSRARVFLHADDWRPDDEVVALLHGIGKACHGKDAIVTSLPFLY